MASDHILQAVRVTKRFGERTAVRDVSLELHRGEVVALLGPNGAGKTTTLRLLMGLLPPSAGSVSVGGVPQSPATWSAARARMGFLTENPGLWDRLSVQANLAVYARLLGVPRAAARIGDLLEQFGLRDRAGDPAATLSKGMRQKVALARTLLHDPEVLLLDEPTSGLDPAMTRAIRERILHLRAERRAILVSTHNLDEAQRIADRVAVLKQTLVALDTPAALRDRSAAPRVRVRLARPAAGFVDAAHVAGVARVRVEGNTLVCDVTSAERDTPVLVRALVQADAPILSVGPDGPGLEDIYLSLVRDAPGEDGEANA